MRQTSRHEIVEKNVYTDVYRLLIAGMLVSTLLFVVGLILALRHPQFISLSADYMRQQYEWSVIRHGLASGNPMIFLMVATILLILTPVARVVVSIYAFFMDGDTKYVVVTSLVLGIMILTVILGLLGVQ